MRYLFYKLLLVFVFLSCQKSDEKIEDLIVGRWEGQCQKAFPLDIEVCPPRSYMEFSGDSVELYSDTYGNGFYTTKYYISDGKIFVNFLVGDSFTPLTYEWGTIEIKKINRNKLIIYGTGSSGEKIEYTYKKN